MMRRSCICRLARTSACLASAAPTDPSSSSSGNTPATDGYGKSVTVEGVMKSHERSSYKYEVSAKGDSVGARNEAAFIPYKEFQPNDLQRKFAMPHMVNLLTVLPVWLVAFALSSLGWGVFLWDKYARKFYQPVIIERPAALH